MSLIMFALPISKQRFKSIIFFNQNSPKMKLFLQKKCKIFERWGLRLQTPVLPAAGGFAPRPPLVSGGWGLSPQTPKHSPLIANFWLRAWTHAQKSHGYSLFVMFQLFLINYQAVTNLSWN